MRNLYILLFSCLPILACSQGKDNLKDKFSDYFLIGATINQEDYQIIDKDEKVLKIVSEITPDAYVTTEATNPTKLTGNRK